MGKPVHSTNKSIKPGKHYPLGASPDGKGTNFALYSQNAEEAFLFMFDDRDSGIPSDVVRMDNRTKNVFHVYVEGIAPGQLYGFKVTGDYIPARGLRFNENKLLIDPYARALSHKFYDKGELLLGYNAVSEGKDLEKDARDNAAIIPKSIVMDDHFEWGGDRQPGIPMEETIIYELHVRGFTRHNSSKVKHPGTYLGIIEKIPYLKSLGVTSLEFLPVHEFCIEDFLVNNGLTNYWGYNTIAFFSPEQTYGTQKSPGCQVAEFKTMVKALHREGLEVILDVVFNHTAEGNELGPTLCFRGIDNPNYYCLEGGASEPLRYYTNYSGCGNSMNLSNPPVIKFVMDCLRYWVEVMHVDGFRFDLASVLGRESGGFFRSAGFFDAVSQDPVLGHIKLIAEPWDMDTNQAGNFPIDWSEWNGRFRDAIRRFAKGDNGQITEAAQRITGSADLYGDDGRTPYNSINFITCHDGFTLYDLVSYNRKHNEKNMENNLDGTDNNLSWNCGIEGDTDDPGVLALRQKQMRNLACLLFLSAGTPMLLAGDEMGRTQDGNNNAYCQDNELTWLNWNLLEKNADLHAFFRKLITFRKRFKVFRRKTFFTGMDNDLDSINDIQWFDLFLGQPDWNNENERKLAFRLDIDDENARGESLFIIYNMDWVKNYYRLPPVEVNRKWRLVIDTSHKPGSEILDTANAEKLPDNEYYIVQPRSTVVLVSLVWQ
ncbi:MAG: glycogen debranching protein GlgX [Spirochaetales bacterium]|nr:glycogen debranching protein GlgX [Spirochaetales bacterium]